MEELLLSLSSYSPHSPRGQELLQVLLTKAATCLRNDLGRPSASLATTRLYLDLAASLVKGQYAPVADLLRFYVPSLTGKITLSRLPANDQTFVICHVAEAIEMLDKTTTIDDSSQLWRKFIDASFILLEVSPSPSFTLVFSHTYQSQRLVSTSDLSEPSSRNACKLLLQSCVHVSRP